MPDTGELELSCELGNFGLGKSTSLQVVVQPETGSSPHTETCADVNADESGGAPEIKRGDNGACAQLVYRAPFVVGVVEDNAQEPPAPAANIPLPLGGLDPKAKFDLLGQAEKAALQAASLIGRVFWSGPVYELLEGLEPDLRVLEERDFVRRRHGSAIEGEREYAIKHAVTREVAYASIPKARRARLHAAFAVWLERFGGGRDEHAPLLAHHFSEAARPEDADLAWAGSEQELDRLRGQAVSWLERAAELAVGRYDIDEGLAYLHRALDYETGRPALARLWHAIGHANALRFDGEAFWTAMQHSLEFADEDSLGQAYSELAFHTATRSGMWKHRPDRDVVDGWIEHALDDREHISVHRHELEDAVEREQVVEPERVMALEGVRRGLDRDGRRARGAPRAHA